MSKDDFEVIVYKVLSYLYECIKQGVKPNLAKAQELAGCNDRYFSVVLDDLLNKGLISGGITRSWGGNIVLADINITLDGTTYLKDNDKMRQVARFLGKAFTTVLNTSIAATSAL